ncbi:MAG: choice-of-anchor B family protein, partial [Ardenticatenaceae bacterium]
SGGMAGQYPCDNVDLLAHMPLNTIGGGNGNDIWGWTDPVTGKEYALAGRTNGTAFVDISDPENPVYVGNLDSHTGNSVWRDIKVHLDHAFIVSDLNGNHGVQVFDLTQLRDVTNPPVEFAETAHYDDVGSAHNIAINEETGYAYAVGAQSCSGGLHMINIQNPTNPTFAGCFSSDGYTHDAQCVLYEGPDTTYTGHEICFAFNEDTVTIVDVTNKSNPDMLSRSPYAGSEYTHQGWITPDFERLLVDDELDEQFNGHNTRTYIWDITNLDAPDLINFFDSTAAAIDHNQYVHQGFAFQANYRAGLRILDLSDIGNGNLSQVGYFDIYPANDSPSFNGAWSTYPYYESGVVVVQGIEQGLFVLQPQTGGGPASLYGTGLRGENEVPPVTTDASGVAIFKPVAGDSALFFRLTVRDIPDITAAHIHCGAAGTNGPVGVTIPLSNPQPIPGGTRYQGVLTTPDGGNGCGWSTMADVLAGLDSGDTYTNVHSSTFPSGEIRGQNRVLVP